MNRSVRHDDRGLIVLEQSGQRANRRLVAGDDGDGAGEPGGAQMLAERIVRDFTPDQRVAHFARAVADAVRRCDGVFRLDEAQLELTRALADAALEAGVDRIDLRRNTHIALAVALGADHTNRRLVNQIRIGTKFSRNPDGLGRAAWMMVNDDDWRFCHGEFLPAGGFFDRQCVACSLESISSGASVGCSDCVTTF
jgi:CO/xanthine dehydrogenase Mo-binding subunit